MKCQKCQNRPASVLLNIQTNHSKEQLNLCFDCYEKIQAEKMKGFNLQNLSEFDSFFKEFSSGKFFNGGNNHKMSQTMTKERPQRGGILDQFGRNLTDLARTGFIDPVIGREKEINRTIEILNRRNKNNPVLIGEPGVGKTAIAEGLALKIVTKDVPIKLMSKEVYSLDVASLVSGTNYRGQFEERLKELLNELQNRKDVILFIDEIHQIVGAGKAEGSMDAGNIFKPALARGEMQLIGATTLKEYRDIEKDVALERRFQPVMVNEPSLEDSISILKGLRDKYEEYHQVIISDEVIETCVKLSHRYIQDRFLPDKAIDLLDEAGSKINLLQKELNPKDAQVRLDEISRQKEEATVNEDYELAAKLRDEERKIETLLTNQKPNKVPVDLSVIYSIIEEKTGIPVTKIEKEEKDKLNLLYENLTKKVIGQDEAVKKISKAIRRSRAGLKSKFRPIGSFLFVGPTGVGKTELTKALAEELFGDKDSLIRLDMSEYMEKHSVSKLIGSPPGYVGHEEAGQLTEKVRRKPYSILLFDEIEKAHPDVQHALLQIMEDGRLTDSQGRTVNFKDTVIIMTSNAGQINKKKTLGFSSQTIDEDYTVLDSLKSYFKPEFLNRVDSIISFKHLEKKQLLSIVDNMLQELIENLQEQNITFEITQKAKEKIVELGYHKEFGARPLRRVIQEHIEDEISDVILTEEIVSNIQVDLVNDEFVVKK